MKNQISDVFIMTHTGTSDTVREISQVLPADMCKLTAKKKININKELIMKKITTSVLTSFILLTFIFSSCSQAIDTENNSSSYDSTRFGKYSEFGADIKKGFEDSANARAAVVSDTNETEDEYVEYLDDNASGAEYLFDNGYISETAKSYIERIEQLFDTEDDSEIEDAITEIETEAMTALSDSDLDNVMYYAEAAKGSISYWSEADNTGEKSIFSKLRRNIKKFKNVFVSSAVGAVAGAGAGFITTGTPAGAIAGAITGGVASGVAASKSGKISVSYKYKRNK